MNHIQVFLLFIGVMALFVFISISFETYCEMRVIEAKLKAGIKKE